MTAHFVWWWEEAAIRKQHFVNLRLPVANRRFFPHPPKQLSFRMSLRVALCKGKRRNEESLLYLL